MKITIEDELRDLIPGFLDNRRKDCAAIATMVEETDFESIRRLGHNMKGTGTSYGFETITDIGRNLENSAQAGSPDSIKALVAELKDYLNNIQIEFKS
jgi:HPt (histidine-containing phosphotransfer) domain-containing protein